MKIEENNDYLKLKLLKKEIVRQLINSEWVPTKHRSNYTSNIDFKNDYFKFEYSGKNWEIYFSEHNKDYLEKYIPLWKFYILKYLFVNSKLIKSLRDKEVSEMLSKADRFFEKNKNLHRDVKIDEILK